MSKINRNQYKKDLIEEIDEDLADDEEEYEEPLQLNKCALISLIAVVLGILMDIFFDNIFLNFLISNCLAPTLIILWMGSFFTLRHQERDKSFKISVLLAIAAFVLTVIYFYLLPDHMLMVYTTISDTVSTVQ